MEAQATQQIRSEPWIGESRIAVDAAIQVTNAALLGLGLVVLGRRLVGAVERPAPATLLLATAAVIGLFSWMSRRWWRAAVPSNGTAAMRLVDSVVGWGPSLAMIFLTLGLSFPMDRYLDWLVWTPLWVADVLWRKSFFAGEPLQDVDGIADQAPQSAAKRQTDVAEAPGEETTKDDITEGVLLQRLSRVRDADGRESIVGELRAEFTPGQRTVELYMPFCPSFTRVPTIELEQADGPPARINVGQVLPHGARIDVRLNEPADAADHVRVDVYACGECHRYAIEPTRQSSL